MTFLNVISVKIMPVLFSFCPAHVPILFRVLLDTASH